MARKLTVRNCFTAPIRRLSFVSGVSRTLQSARDECDINSILRKFRNGEDILPEYREPLYADVSRIPDLYTGELELAGYRNYFSTLSSDVRAEFKNDYRNMLAASPELLAKHKIFGVEFTPKESSVEPPVSSVPSDPVSPPT